jgi:hypothetical protein
MQDTACFLDRITTLLPIALSIATFFLSAAVGVVAWLQWRVARNKLRLDLFDRRYKVFEATRKFLALILRNTRFEDSELIEFDLATSDAEFLFKRDVVDLLAEIRTQALDLRIDEKLLERPQNADEIAKRANAKNERLKWLGDQVTELTKLFGRYLRFGHVK